MVYLNLNVKFEKWYFERWHSYDKKKKAIIRLYYDVISWANKFAPFDLLYGKDKVALDVGCAHGYVTQLLTSLGYDAYGCDISRLYLHNYAKKVSKNLVLCDAQMLPFSRESFNVILAFEVLEHLKNQGLFLKRCYECLKFGGVLILQTPIGIPSIDALFSKLYGLALAKNSNIEQHINALVSKSNLVYLLEWYGFKSHVETWFLLPVKPTLFERYFPTRIPLTVPTFRAVAVKLVN